MPWLLLKNSVPKKRNFEGAWFINYHIKRDFVTLLADPIFTPRGMGKVTNFDHIFDVFLKSSMKKEALKLKFNWNMKHMSAIIYAKYDFKILCGWQTEWFFMKLKSDFNFDQVSVTLINRGKK